MLAARQAEVETMAVAKEVVVTAGAMEVVVVMAVATEVAAMEVAKGVAPAVAKVVVVMAVATGEVLMGQADVVAMVVPMVTLCTNSMLLGSMAVSDCSCCCNKSQSHPHLLHSMSPFGAAVLLEHGKVRTLLMAMTLTPTALTGASTTERVSLYRTVWKATSSTPERRQNGL